MKFTQWMQSHHRSILFLLMAFAVGGVFSTFQLPVGLFPRVSFPRVRVMLDAGDRPAKRMAVEVTEPVERAVRSVPGVREVRSQTSRGSADISINFDWGQDMVQSTLQVESAINQIMGQLPAATTFEVNRMDPTVDPVLGYSLTSETESQVELRNLARYTLRPVLSTVTGVAKIGVQGGEDREYRVTVDPAKLNSFNLSLNDVANALTASNVITAVGRLQEDHKLYLVVSNTQFQGFKQIGQTVLRSGGNGLVTLNDVATVSKSTVPRWTTVTADGHPAVLVNVYQQPGGNTVQIAKGIKAKLASLKGQLPKNVKVANWYDQSQLIVASAASVRDAIIIGVIFAAVVLLIFLRNIKVTFIAMVTVPMVLAATVLLLYELHMSFNIMTLGGMAAAVALIIDDAIVMIEHIIRRLRSTEGDYRQRISTAVAEFTKPLAGSSSSTIIIFMPLAFLSGVTGAFFKALSLTMAASLAISFLIAWLAVPILGVHLLSDKDANQKEGGRITDWMHGVYGWFMKRMLPVPWLMLVLMLPLLAGGYLAYQHIGSGFLPHMDEGGFILDYRAAPGTSLEETNHMLRQVGHLIDQVPDVQTYSRRTGLQLGGGITGASTGDFFIRLKPQSQRRPIEQVMEDVRTRVEHHVPGLDIEEAQLMEDLIGDLTAVPQPIEIKLYSDNGQLLDKLGPKVANAISHINGVVGINDGVIPAGAALDITVDRQKAALEGVAPSDITQMLKNYLTGQVTTQVQRGPRMVGIRVWIPHNDRNSTVKLKGLQMRAPDGHLFPLSRVASVKIITGQPQITRDNLKRMVAVSARIQGRDMGSTIADVKQVLEKKGLIPKSVYYELGGLYRQQQIAFKGLMEVFGAAVVLVFVLLLFLYESFRVAIAMLITTLLAMGAVFIGLWATGTELNITAMMGMTMVIGIVTEVGIFYYSEYRDLEGQGTLRERLIKAGQNRMRPIAMTTLAAILALLPLALGIGSGSAMQQPLAIAIISGLIVQLPLVLTVLPAILEMMGHSKRGAAEIH